MNFKVLIGAVLIIGLVNSQPTQLEILKAVNYARANPTIVANRILNRIRTQQAKGPQGDENCYQEAVDTLSVMKGVSLLEEDVGMDVAAWTQADDMRNNIRRLRHKGSDLSTVKQRMRRFGNFKGTYNFFEMLAFFKQTQPVPADKLVDLFITDCGDKNRPHRKIIFETDVTHFGAGISYGDGETWITFLASKGFTRKPIKNVKLDEAWVEGEGLYKGPGQSFTMARWREAGEFMHNGPQIHTENLIIGAKSSTGPLGSLTDDGSTTCPNFINSKILGIKVVHDWHPTTEKCDRMQAPWMFSQSFIKRTLPFAQKNKCFHRLAYCLWSRVWVIDREYKTFSQFAKETSPASNNLIGDAKDDLSIKCPKFINPSLRKKVISDWYPDGEKCQRNLNGFEDNGFFRINPFAKKGKCYQRLKFCTEDGLVYLKDSEYVTYAEWEATNQ